MIVFPQNIVTFIVFFPKKNLCTIFFFGQYNLKIHQKQLFGMVGPIVENEDRKVSKQTPMLHVSNAQ